MARSPETPAEREARIQRILRQMEQKLREQLPDPHQTLEQIEQEVVEIGRGLRAILERETLDAAGTGYHGSQTACACGRAADASGTSSTSSCAGASTPAAHRGRKARTRRPRSSAARCITCGALS